jgi:hypothetical protein
LLTARPGSPSVRIIALVCAGDAFGKSMAVLAGADIAYLKGIDGELLRDDLLHWAGGGDASGRSTSRRRRDAACPLFDPRMIEFVGLQRAPSKRLVVMRFLEMLHGQIRSLRSACSGQDGQGAHKLQQFAGECRAAGAIRAGEETELLRCALLTRGAQPSDLIVDYFDLLLCTVREMTAWSLDCAPSGA